MRGRTTILGLMSIIALAGVAFAALRTASALWACALFTIAFFATVVGAIGSLSNRGRARAGWGGFTIACGSYLVITFGLLADASGVSAPPLATTILFNWTASKLDANGGIVTYNLRKPENPLDNASGVLSMIDPSLIGIPPEIGAVVRPLSSSDPLGVAAPSVLVGPGQANPSLRPVFPIHHHRIGHTLAALILGIAGAILGKSLSPRV